MLLADLFLDASQDELMSGCSLEVRRSGLPGTLQAKCQRVTRQGVDAELNNWLAGVEFVEPRTHGFPTRRSSARLPTAVKRANLRHMKRTNLVLDERLLAEATRLSGEKTYSGAVMRALEDFVRRVKARQILELRGSGLWEGDLREMRGDRRRKKGAS